jgi:HYR domain
MNSCIARIKSRSALATILLFVSLGLLLAPGPSDGQTAQSQHVRIGSDGRLVYVPYPNADTIPDFSNAGYGGGGVALPNVAVKKTITPVDGDDGANIQAAIDEVSALAPEADGFRGAVLLKAGTYEVGGSVRISASGVVLRGEGDGPGGTLIKATGVSRRTVINVAGVGNRAETPGTRQAITNSYLPVGSHTITVADTAGFSVGDNVLVVRTPNQEWIDAVGMDACSTVGTAYDTSDVNGSTCISEDHWTPSARVMRYERKVTAISGNQITIDAPVVEAFQAEFGGGYVAKYEFPGRIEKCGVEYLRSESDFASDTDENHATRMISLSNVQNAWVRNVTSVYFEQGTVLVGGGAKYVTVQDSVSLDHKSVITGGRRYPFSLDDCSFVLVMRCFAKTGRHDYVTGSNTPGPNVFLDSRAEQSFSELGPHHRWATGTLFDLIRHESFNGSQIIGTYNRGNSGSGHGWSGAYQLFWNIVGDTHRVASPPHARNWAIGSQALRRQGDGEFELFGTPVLPSSLYLQQLRDRLGDSALANIGYSSMPPLPGPPRPMPTPTPAPTPAPTPPAISFEAEFLQFTTSGPPRVLENDNNASNRQWVAFPMGVVGDWIEYTLQDVPSGTYDVVMKYKTHPNRGVHTLSVDGVVIGTPLDQFRTGTSIFPEKNFGTVRFGSAGNHVIRLTVIGKNDRAGSFGIAADRFSLVQDIKAPTIVVPGDLTVEATGPNGAVVAFEASATDDKDGPVTVALSPPSGSVLPLGTTEVVATATDFAGNEATKSFFVTVKDTTPPVIQSLTASPDMLWPPNHKMVPVSLTAQVNEAVDPAPITLIVSVTSNEPVNGEGDGDTEPDWEITGALTLNLRAERQGDGSGRVYTITVESRDFSGNKSARTVTVSAPKNQGKP